MTTRQSAFEETGHIIRERMPGIFLCGIIAATSFWASQFAYLSTLSPILLAVVFGILFRLLLTVSPTARLGIGFSMRPLLRLAIVLLGMRITLDQIGSIGISGLAVLAGSVTATMIFVIWLGRVMKSDMSLAMLIASGTSICGASAIMATSASIQSKSEDNAYALAIVTLMGTISMVTYPLMGELLGLSAHEYGLWVGASVHEVAQVVAAGYQFGMEAGETATVAKLARILALAPIVMILGYFIRKKALWDAGEDTKTKSPMVPGFIVGFAVMAVVNSLISIPEQVVDLIQSLVAFMLAMALAAVGLETDASAIRKKGVGPLVLGAAATIFIAGVSLILMMLFA